MGLPSSIDPDDFDERLRPDAGLWLPSVRALCEALGLPSGGLSAFAGGSNLVASVGRRVIKVFPPFHRDQWESERRALPAFGSRLPVEVPALEVEGEHEGWPFVVISRVPGEGLDEAWPRLSLDERASLMGQIGALMRAAHALPVGGLASLPPRWADFLPRQIEGCRARHERLGAPSWLIDEVDSFVADALPGLDLGEPHSILTGEYTPFNLLIERDDRGPRLSSMIDMGDAMVGPRVYDLLGPSLFLAAGEPALLGPLIEASGQLAWPLPRPARRGLMALSLLHRYSNLDGQIKLAGWRQRASSLDGLASLLWPG